MSDFSRELDEASASYQINKQDFCGVSMDEKHAFDAGAEWCLTSSVVRGLVEALKKCDSKELNPYLTHIAREALQAYERATGGNVADKAKGEE